MKKYLIFLAIFIFFPLLVGATANDLLIVEVQIAGKAISNDFVKIYNPSSEDIDIGGYKLRKKTSSGSESSVRVFPADSLIKSKNYFLWANSKDGYATSMSANVESATTLAKNNSLAFLNPNGEVISALSWGEGDAPFVEGSPFSQNPGKNQKLIRKQSAEIYQNTNDNSQDFYLNPLIEESETSEQESELEIEIHQDQPSISAPIISQNNSPVANAGEDKIALSGQEITFDGSLSGDQDGDALTFLWNFGQGETIDGQVATTTYLYPGEYVVSLKVSDGSLEDTNQIVVDIYPTKIWVSEFLANPLGEDETGEWLEIYNPSDFWVDLDSWQLDDEEGGSKSFIIPENTFIKPKGYLIFPRQATKIAFNNGRDGVRILFPNGDVSDVVQYEGNQEGIAGARKGEKIFWTEVLTPGSANLIYLSSEENFEKESFLPFNDELIVGKAENKEIISILPNGQIGQVSFPSLEDLDELSLFGQTAKAAVMSSDDFSPNGLIVESDNDTIGQATINLPKFTAGSISDKINNDIEPLFILFFSVIISSFLFALSIISWRKRISSDQSYLN